MLHKCVVILLGLVSIGFVPIACLGIVGGESVSGLGGVYMGALIAAPVAAFTVIGWMVVRIFRDVSLSAAERRKWIYLIFVGGPITAVCYLVGRVR